MNDYISTGLDKDLVDPDGGVNAEKKKAELGLLSKNKDNMPLELKQFPDKGFEWEPRIIERFMKETGHQVRRSGFVLSESHPFLGASPDGITEEDKLVEVKKVVSKEGEDLGETMCRLSIYKRDGDGISINKNHKYFYQVQQQLFCTNLEACHFIVCNW